MFIIERILTNSIFKQAEGVEEVYLCAGIFNTKLVVLFQAWLDVVELVYLLDYFFFFFLKDPLKVFFVFLLFFEDKFLKLPKLLLDKLFMYFISLLNSWFVSLASSHVPVDVLNALLGLYFVFRVEMCDVRKCIRNWAYIVVFLLFHVFIHALHAHHHAFLLAVKHQWLLVQVAFHFLQTLSGPTAVFSSTLWVMTGLATAAILWLWSLALIIDIAPTLCIGHHFEFTLA